MSEQTPDSPGENTPKAPVFDASTRSALQELISESLAAALSAQQQGEHRHSGEDIVGPEPDPATEPRLEGAAEAANTAQVTDTPAAAPNEGTQDAAAWSKGDGEGDQGEEYFEEDFESEDEQDNFGGTQPAVFSKPWHEGHRGAQIAS